MWGLGISDPDARTLIRREPGAGALDGTRPNFVPVVRQRGWRTGTKGEEISS